MDNAWTYVCGGSAVSVTMCCHVACTVFPRLECARSISFK